MTDVDPLLRRRPVAPPMRSVERQAQSAKRAVPARPRRRHPALGARIAAAGIGMTTMLGLVASMGVADSAADGDSAGAASSAASPSAAPATAAPVTPPVPAGSTSAAVAPAPAPVTLTARPDVRVVTAPAAPAANPTPSATTRGSR